ncbi:unnamed protein product [Cuscuta europaea]|uniref:3-methyl-2-oxobutanoate dehydrogenase (2-methylpropanoyl-transferring) n=1 Tax=Cuscuta europaea TaxID=41803 RepID=A0A9P0ZT79_CUSEU|nr:unnamed protein product [Cuscuta europaea]
MASSSFSKSRTLVPYLLSTRLAIHQSSHFLALIPSSKNLFGFIPPPGGGGSLLTLLTSRRFIQSIPAEPAAHVSHDLPQVLDFPGGKVEFTHQMKFISETIDERIHCYRVLNDEGLPLSINFLKIDKKVAQKIYTDMVTLQTMDTIFYEAQRQGRISFYVTTIGEEAINIASAAALRMDDVIFPQYREPGVLLWRGFTLQEFANQCFGNKYDNGKGRQMPIHYGSNKLNYFTVSSTVATQIPHAVGAAYSLKMDGQDACAVVYFGDGGSSTGDFHAALNFAGVMEVPVIFFCRNNGWAISTPVRDQFRSDGVVSRGKAYGVRSIRVDGNDALAIFNAVSAAREIAVKEHKPVLIEALTYRAGHHSTSDDSTKYRSSDEIELWKRVQDPVTRFRKWIQREGWWDSAAESQLQTSIRKQVLYAIQVAEKAEKPPITEVFTDVYDVPPANLLEQEISLRDTIRRHPHDYSSDVPF